MSHLIDLQIVIIQAATEKLAIGIGKVPIDSNIDTIEHGKYTNNFFIRLLPVSGKTWCMEYIVLYAMDCGLKVITTAIMAKRAIQL